MLGDWCWGPAPIPVRQLLSLIRHLPSDSATARTDPSAEWWWSPELELQAQVLDAVTAALTVGVGQLAAAGVKRNDIDRVTGSFVRFRRPTEPPPRGMSIADLITSFAGR